jgi:hypothetical protein
LDQQAQLQALVLELQPVLRLEFQLLWVLVQVGRFQRVRLALLRVPVQAQVYRLLYQNYQGRLDLLPVVP